MAINRFDLVRAISLAQKNGDEIVYDELLKIFYTMLEQEEIRNDFITEFITYNLVSDSALSFLASQI